MGSYTYTSLQFISIWVGQRNGEERPGCINRSQRHQYSQKDGPYANLAAVGVLLHAVLWLTEIKNKRWWAVLQSWPVPAFSGLQTQLHWGSSHIASVEQASPGPPVRWWRGHFSCRRSAKGRPKGRLCHDMLKCVVKTMCWVWPPGHCEGTLTAQPQQSWVRVWDVALT